jgi:LacI family transcriptional regulator
VADKSRNAQAGNGESIPTLVEVAKLAGVGLGTASRALSGEGYVKQDTLDRVRKAIEQLGYQPNEVARGLKTKKTNAIGLVIPDIGGPFMADCVRAIQKVLRSKDYMTLIAFTDGDESIEAKEIDYLLRRRIDGLILVPANGDAPHLQSARLKHIAVVAFDQEIHEGFDAVLIKNRQMASEAVRHLIGHGHTRIACLGINRHLTSIQRRIEGYEATMKQAGLKPLLGIVNPEHNEIAAQLDAWFALKSPPTAIFSLNELTSLQTVEALLERGLTMPDQVAFVGFDDIQLGPFLNPPLTAVIQPAVEIGECVATRLLERIAAHNDLPQSNIKLDSQLVLRGSCGCEVPRARAFGAKLR